MPQTSAFTRLTRILDLEQKQGWRNRGVIGGMLAMSERWATDAREEAADEAIVNAVVTLMAVYEAAAPAKRPEVAEKLRAALAGELATAATSALEAQPEPPVSQARETPPAKKPAPAPPPKPAPPPPQSATAAVEEDFLPEGSDDSGMVYEADFTPPEPAYVTRERARRQQPKVERKPQDLQASPTIIAGIGTVAAEQLARLDINRVIDLLWHLPTRHEDYSTMRTIAQLQPGEQVTVIANLWEVKERKIGINRQVIQGILADGTGTLHATWWNKFVRNQLTPGTTMRFSGKVGLYLGQKTLDNPAFEDADDEMVATGRLAPIYRLTEGITHKRLRNLIHQVLEEFVHFLSDPLPREIREEFQMSDLARSLEQIHFPDSAEHLAAARRRLAFEELFYVQLGVLQRRRELHQRRAWAMSADDEVVARFTEALPFALTGAQQRVLAEIRQDLRRNTPMTRLVQGDVGSGKTAVAAGAMWLVAHNGLQSALIAPTQILAEQHHRSLSKLLTPLTRADGTPLQVALLTGRVTGNEREQVLAGLSEGTIDVVVGTTALIQEHVEFSNLGFVVVDEQHRFGVEQRGALRSRNNVQPHLLVMSATPIPRSLALTVFGDLDISVIDEMPAGRIPIMTKLFRPSERERLYSFLKSEVKEGRQAFIVYPLVEESDKLDVGAAVEAHEKLRNEILPNLRIALLHGRMTGSEKDEVMRAFANREYDVLVSTSVIEVGIDVPNASLMIIEDAERFGLAQLHQFRGRVGRGEHKSYCALVSKAEHPDAEARLRALTATNNGFVLAEKDLELRGPGDFLGTRQSGLPDLRIAHLSDLDTVALARTAAQKFFAQDPMLHHHPALEKQVRRFWRGHGDVN